MMKTVLNTTLCICLFATFTACSENVDNVEDSESIVQTTDQEATSQEPEGEVKKSSFGKFSELIGEWTVDAATAGVKMDLTFGEDGSFKQVIGPINGIGTWKPVDDEHIKVVTQNMNTEGKTWKISNLTVGSVNLCWNPDAAKPKTIPMLRVK